MNSKQLIAAVGALIVLIAIYMALQPGKQMKKTVAGDGLAVDTTQVAQIVVEAEEAELDFRRSGETWTLEDYPLDTARFNPLLAALGNLQIDRFVSSKSENFEKYGVADEGPKLHLKDSSGAELTSFHLGNSGATFNETFVRLVGGQKVFAALANLSSFRTAKKADYWDKAMVEFETAFVSGVGFEGEFNYALANSPQGWTYNAEPADSAKVVQTLQRLSSMRASGFYEGQMEVGAEPVQKILVSISDGRLIALNFYAHPSEETSYLATVENKTKVFEVAKSRLENLDKSYDDLKLEEPELQMSEEVSEGASP